MTMIGKAMKRLIILLLAIQVTMVCQAHEWLSDILQVDIQNEHEYEIISYEEIEPYQELRYCNSANFELPNQQDILGYVVQNKEIRANISDEERDGGGACQEFDHFTAAQVMAIMMCAGYEVNLKAIRANPHDYFDDYVFDLEEVAEAPFPVYLGPESFVTDGVIAGDHHDSYDLSQGLKFYCARKVLVQESLSNSSY